MKKILALTLAVATLFALASCGAPTYSSETPEALAESYVNAIFANNGEAYYSLTVDKYELENRIKSGFCADEAECIAYYSEELAKKYAGYEESYGTGLEFSDFEIIEQNTYTEDELAHLIAHLEENTYPADAVEDIQNLKVRFKVSGSDRDVTLSYQQTVAKIDGQWYWGVTNLLATDEDMKNLIERLKNN